MSKYTIITTMDYDSPAKYRGKYAELQTTLDAMEVGNCILVSTQKELGACLSHSKSKAFHGYRVRTRSDKTTGGWYVWKMEGNAGDNNNG